MWGSCRWLVQLHLITYIYTSRGVINRGVRDEIMIIGCVKKQQHHWLDRSHLGNEVRGYMAS